MRKIEIHDWDIIDKEGKNAKEDLLVVLQVLITMKKPEDLPRGFEQFRLFHKLAKAFDKARETKELVLEEKEYEFLKNTVLRDIPMTWSGNPNIYNSIDLFMNAKEE